MMSSFRLYIQIVLHLHALYGNDFVRSCIGEDLMTAPKIAAAALALLALAGCAPYGPSYSDSSGYYGNRAYYGGPGYYGSPGYGYSYGAPGYGYGYGGDGSYRAR
jgi:hypothetical protein